MTKIIMYAPLLLIFSITQSYAYLVTEQVYLDVEQNGKPLGRIEIGLFGEIAPRTVANFKAIATKGINSRSYSGSVFHRIIPRFMIQGGDILNGDGTGSISIYGPQFDDETFEVQHRGAGFVSMANYGPNSNGCQFFITTMQTSWLDNKHVIFGKVIKGQGVVHKIEHLKRDSGDRPLQPVVIIESGELATSEPFVVYDEDYGLIGIIQAGIVPLSFSTVILIFFHWIIKKLERAECIEKELIDAAVRGKQKKS